uniref:Uncharacterized protein n=1 Tax=Medicago truncatula TaxID=3880 RepID=A2Q569_MEDTR|nr:hypothetical protein MtrDRAFT_AC160012g27v2 [Medicago truncatula]
MVPQSKAGKTFGLKEHLQRYLHLPPSKGTNGARTRVLSDSKPVILSLDQAFGVVSKIDWQSINFFLQHTEKLNSQLIIFHYFI